MPSLAHTVLTHYTRACQGEEMTAWLQRQAVPFYQLVAGELIAYGAASASDAVALFCAAFREWATWPDSDFSRSVFSRSVAALAELLDYDCAASALVQVASDELVTVQRRIIAAEVLANAGPPYTENGGAVLRHVLANPGAHVFAWQQAAARQESAVSLAGLGPRYRDEAAIALRRVIANPGTSAYARRRAAISLDWLDPRYRDEAANVLRDTPAPNARGIRAKPRQG